MKLNLFSKILFAVVLAYTVNAFIYFSFGNIYSAKLLNAKNFTAQYNNGVYQYRFLGRTLLIWIYKALISLPFELKLKTKFLERDAEPKMLLAYYLLNTFFLALSAVMMVLIMESKNFIATKSEKLLMVSASVFVIVITQFVLVPYDCSSYFFQLFFFYFFLKYLQNRTLSTLVLLISIIILSTTNRESSALSISLAATLFYDKFGLKKSAVLPLFWMTLSFAVTYIGIRYMHTGFITNEGNLLLKNFSSPQSLLGILFWIVFFLFTILVADSRKSVKNIIIFHIFSLPYIMMCFYSGILYEIRLYVPLFLSSLLLARVCIPQTILKN